MIVHRQCFFLLLSLSLVLVLVLARSFFFLWNERKGISRAEAESRFVMSRSAFESFNPLV